MRLFFFLQLTILCFLPTAAALALDVPVRTGSHDTYSRLVFDWPKPVPYTVERANEKTLSIKFGQDADLNSSALKNNPVANISALSVVSNAPLHIDLNVPEKSRIRDFVVGNRLIIDVYNPPGGAGKPRPLEVTVPSTHSPSGKTPEKTVLAPPEAALSSPVLHKKPAPESLLAPHDVPGEQHKKESTSGGAAPLPPSEVVREPLHEPPHKDDDIIKIKPKALPTVVTMSSTQGFGFAAFENAGRLWVVADRDDKFLSPQVSGPEADRFRPVEAVDTKGAKSFTLRAPDNLPMKGQGGGVLWRVLASEELNIKDPVCPLRMHVDPQKTRGGNLMWPLKSARKIVEIKDDLTGEHVRAVTVDQASDFSGKPQNFVDFDVLNSPVGLAIIPKVDDLKVKIVRGGVEISRPGGLALSEEFRAKIATRMAESGDHDAHTADDETQERLFDFEGWRMGGLSALPENRTLILARIHELSPSERVENLMTLAKAYLANSMGPEALGVLGFAQQEVPEMEQMPAFKSLTGVAKAMSRKSEGAFKDFSHKGLRDFPEIGLWRAYVLRDLGDWQQAAELLPGNAKEILAAYPPAIKVPVALGAAEVHLRAGDTHGTGELLQMVEKYARRLPRHLKAELEYLKGEKARQEGSFDDTKMYWLKLARGEDDLYRVKSALALTRLLMEKENMSPAHAIDKLEHLRYAWRGDDLEAQVNYWLGKTYFQGGQHVKGLNIMRDSTTYTSRPALAQRIANDMSKTFVNLFTSDELGKVSAIDAVTLYEQFSELLPPDSKGDEVVEKLAEHLVTSGLLGRGGDLLQRQVEHRLRGHELYRVAIRLAAIRLLDNRPDDAMNMVDTARATLKELPEELQTEKNNRIISLLHARALSGQGRPDQALALLVEMDLTPDVNRLRADIAWRASYWEDAAEALRDVILDQNISLTRPLTEGNAELLMQRAIALNLAGDRVALSNMREKYAQSMSQTEKAKTFEVISRPRQNITLSDRETLLSIVSEVDLFSSILNDSIKGE